MHLIIAPNFPVPSPLPHWVKPHADGSFTLTGTSSGGVVLCYAIHEGALHVASSLTELIDGLKKTGMQISLNAAAISCHLSQMVHIPALTPYLSPEGDRVRTLAYGDVVTIEKTAEGYSQKSRKITFPYLTPDSRGDSVPSTKTLLDLLCKAVTLSRNEKEPVALMLSSGKDSLGLAIALAETDWKDTRCVTFAFKKDEPRALLAKEYAEKLGLFHEIVQVENLTPARMEAAIAKRMEQSPLPCSDPTLIPYITCMESTGINEGKVLDGIGNDTSFGYILTNKKMAALYPVLKMMKPFQPFLEKLPFTGKLRASYISPLHARPLDAMMPWFGFRYDEAKEFFDGAKPRVTWWKEEEEATKDYIAADARRYVIGRIFDPFAGALKGAVTNPGVAGMAKVAWPWMNPELSDYIFHLPLSARCDMEKGRNKLLLRQMLLEKLGYDADKLPKEVFEFDRRQFLLDYRGMVKSAILRCGLWNKHTIGNVVSRLFAATEAKDFRESLKLINLYLISAWFNHSRFTQQFRDIAQSGGDVPLFLDGC